MFATLGIELILTLDGKVLVGDYFEEDETEPREAKSFAEVAMAIVLGAEARNCPELLELLPERPKESSDCEKCDDSSGWFQPVPKLGPFICETCGGLGWIFNEEPERA